MAWHYVHFLLQKLKVSNVGVELIDVKSGDLRWCLDFRDMGSPAIIILPDAYGKKSAEYGGFVLCPLYGRKSKAFQASSGTSNSAIISNLVSWNLRLLHILLILTSSWLAVCANMRFVLQGEMTKTIP